MSNEYKYNDYMNLYKNDNNWHNQKVCFESAKTCCEKRSIWCKVKYVVKEFLSFTFVRLPSYVYQSLKYVFENISKVISIRIDLFCANDPLQELVELKNENEKLKAETAEMYSENQILRDFIGERWRHEKPKAWAVEDKKKAAKKRPSSKKKKKA